MGKNTNGELGTELMLIALDLLRLCFNHDLLTNRRRGDADNSLFKISGTQLKTNEVFDFETKELFTVRVRATDPDGLFFEKNIEILINNTTRRRILPRYPEIQY